MAEIDNEGLRWDGRDESFCLIYGLLKTHIAYIHKYNHREDKLDWFWSLRFDHISGWCATLEEAKTKIEQNLTTLYSQIIRDINQLHRAGNKESNTQMPLCED